MWRSKTKQTGKRRVLEEESPGLWEEGSVCSPWDELLPPASVDGDAETIRRLVKLVRESAV